jgi:uncharacterized protein YdiU (UPF0061 family)
MNKRTIFLKVKEKYEYELKEMKINEYKLRANYDPYDSENSYNKMFDEVYEKTKAHLVETRNDIWGISSEISYIINILEEDLSECESQINKLKNNFNDIEKKCNFNMIKNYEELKEWIKEFNPLSKIYEELRKKSREFLKVKPVTVKEGHVLEYLSENKSKELKELIIKLSEDESIKELDQILKLIGDLFKKNQITILIGKRR